MCPYMCLSIHIEAKEQPLVISSLFVPFRAWAPTLTTLVVRLGSKYPYPVSHLGYF